MAKTVSRKVNKATTVSKKDENTEYRNLGKLPPLEEKVKANEIDYLGNKLADLSERINEVELSMESLGRDIKRVMGRMGL